MKNVKKSFILNIIIFLLEVFSLGWMMSGISSGTLSASRLAMLRYFTVDSNILMGLFAFITAIDEWKVLKGKKKDVAVSSLVLKLTGTVGVTLTMLVTIFFLTPTMADTAGLFGLFYYSNFFLHLANPLLSIITFLCFEKTDRIAFRHTFTGIIPMLLYSVYYMEEALTHVEPDGMIARGYDWYGFFIGGAKSAVVALPLLILITYAISLSLWKVNRNESGGQVPPHFQPGHEQ